MKAHSGVAGERPVGVKKLFLSLQQCMFMGSELQKLLSEKTEVDELEVGQFIYPESVQIIARKDNEEKAKALPQYKREEAAGKNKDGDEMLVCEHCGASFRSKYSLKQHKKLKHPHGESGAPSEDGASVAETEGSKSFKTAKDPDADPDMADDEDMDDE